jgi:hypothetical protein
MRCTLAIAVLLAGCSAAPASQDDPLPLPPDPPPAPIAHQSPPATVATLTPPEIVLAAEQAHRDASGYVAWRLSKPENIDRLTTLTANMNAAVAVMKAGRVRGRYKPTDVLAARAAVRELRSFLANKGD